MSHGRPAVRRLSRFQPLMRVREAGYRALWGRFPEETEEKRGLELTDWRAFGGRKAGTEKENKQVPINRDLLQETVYQLFDCGCCKVRTGVLTSNVNTLQYEHLLPQQTTNQNWTELALFPLCRDPGEAAFQCEPRRTLSSSREVSPFL